MRQKLWTSSISKSEARLREIESEAEVIRKHINKMKQAQEAFENELGSGKIGKWNKAENKKTHNEQYFELIVEDYEA